MNTHRMLMTSNKQIVRLSLRTIIITCQNLLSHANARKFVVILTRLQAYTDISDIKIRCQSVKLFGREDNIGTNLRGKEWEGLDWICLTQNRVQWRVLVNTVMNLRVP
jgi:hypothetical protein